MICYSVFPERIIMENQISRTAHELTITFQDDSDIPTRFKKGKKTTKSKIDPNSKVELAYQQHLAEWSLTINSILQNVPDSVQAWRFIRINPKVDDINLNSVTQCADFIAFTDLLIQRRDIDKCSDTELGKLCMLSGAFQKEIEKVIKL